MKKLQVVFALFVLLCVEHPSNAKPIPAGVIQRKVIAADSETRSIDAHNKASFDMQMKVRFHFKDQKQGKENTVKKDCAAAKIDNNWLIASLRCRGTDPNESDILLDGSVVGKPVAYRKIEWLKVEGIQVNANSYFVDETAKLILIQTNTQTNLVDKLAKKGNVVANLLIAKNPAVVLKAIKDAYINRERFRLPGRCSDCVGINEYCSKTKCYKLEWELIDGDSGDPLFFLSNNHGKSEFLAGFNDAENPLPGRDYRVFDQNTLAFIKRIIGAKDPDAFYRIQRHIVDETTF